MPQGERDGAREGTLTGVVEQVDDVLEDEVLIVANGHLQVVGRHAISLSILEKRARLVLLGDLNVLWDPTEDLIGLAIIEAHQDEPGLSDVPVSDVGAVDVAGEVLLALGKEAAVLGPLGLLLGLLSRHEHACSAAIAVDCESLAARLPCAHVDVVDRLARRSVGEVAGLGDGVVDPPLSSSLNVD